MEERLVIFSELKAGNGIREEWLEEELGRKITGGLSVGKSGDDL